MSTNETAAQPTPPDVLYHCTMSLHAKDDVILPGNWGRIIEGWGVRHNHFYREYVLERIRAAEFSEKPTRMNACYVCDDETFARNWNRFAQQGTSEHVYAVRLVDPSARCHRGDMTFIDTMPSQRTFAGVDECARRYWRGAQAASPRFEWVIAGAIVVDARVSKIAEDDFKAPVEAGQD